MVRSSLCALVLVAVAAGCGGRSDKDVSPLGRGGGGGSSGSGGSAGAEDRSTLVIPVEPLEQASLGLVVQANEGVFSGAYEQGVTLGLGEEYPPVLRIDLKGSFVVTDNGSLFDGSQGLALEAATALSEGIAARFIHAASFELESEREGDFEVLLEGTWSPFEPDQPPAARFAFPIGVRVRRVARAVLDGCSSDPRYVVSGSAFEGARLEVFDGDGVSFSPWNASGARPLTVTVTAASGTKLATSDGLSSLVATGADQTVELSSALGPLGTFELVQPGAIDGLAARFYLESGARRSTELLSSGETRHVPAEMPEPAEIEVVPELSIGSVRVCSAPPVDWFELRSATPGTCPLRAEPVCTDDCWLGTLPFGAGVVGPGACELSLHAAEFDQGRGLEAALSVTFVE